MDTLTNRWLPLNNAGVFIGKLGHEIALTNGNLPTAMPFAILLPTGLEAVLIRGRFNTRLACVVPLHVTVIASTLIDTHTKIMISKLLECQHLVQNKCTIGPLRSPWWKRVRNVLSCGRQ